MPFFLRDDVVVCIYRHGPGVYDLDFLLDLGYDMC